MRSLCFLGEDSVWRGLRRAGVGVHAFAVFPGSGLGRAWPVTRGSGFIFSLRFMAADSVRLGP